jgi:hypothetical protein
MDWDQHKATITGLKSWLFIVQVHGEFVLSEPELMESLSELLTDIETSWSGLHADIQTTLCLLTFCKSSFL